jgi:hypothetical protein
MTAKRNTTGDPMLDLFYVAIGVAGMFALWALAKACDRV